MANGQLGDDRVKELSDGNRMPLVGLGVYQITDEPECAEIVATALRLGYRHLDTAQDYGNERAVGQGIAQSGISRDELFVTTKFLPSRADPVAELEGSLERLGLDFVDLYLVHWPQGGPTWAWPGMERAKRDGLAKSIGVSNFDAAELDAVVAVAVDPPVVNQLQLSPFEHRKALIEDCLRHRIAPEAYSPLGVGRHVSDPVIKGAAQRVGRTPAQVLLRWGLQRGFIVIPKTAHEERLRENLAIFDFELPEDLMRELDACDTLDGTQRAVEFPWW